MKTVATVVLLATVMGQSNVSGQTVAIGDAFADLVPVSYNPQRLAHLRAVWPAEGFESEALVWARLGPGQAASLDFFGELRIVNWNASAHERNKHRPAATVSTPWLTLPGIADDILAQVDYFNANVITLQEQREDVYRALRDGLFERDERDGLLDHRAWTCEAHEFGAMRDFRITCVKGPLANLRVRRLVNAGALHYPRDKNREFWGYMQVDYYGVTITNVHVRDHWDRQHVCQLHHEVRTGVVAGDFNYPTPEQSPDHQLPWFQTDVNGPPTWQQEKIDHVLTVEPHVYPHAELAGKHGSNHEMLLTRFRFLVPVNASALPSGAFEASTGCIGEVR